MQWIKRGVAILLLLTASFSYADQALNGKVIEQWLSSIDAIQAWGQKQDALDDDMPDDPNEAFSVDRMIAKLNAAGLYDEASQVIRSNGFDSVEQWADIQMRIIKAMVALEMEQQKVDMNVQAQLDQIKNDPSIPADQKEMMLNMMQSSMKMMQEMSKAPESDKKAIKPYLAQIKQKLEDDEPAQ